MVHEMSFDSTAPLYLQIAERLRIQIASGELQVGQALQTVQELASHLRINPNLVQRAYEQLKQEGLLVSDNNKRYFVTMAPPKLEALRMSLLDEELKALIEQAKHYGISKEYCLEALKLRW